MDAQGNIQISFQDEWTPSLAAHEECKFFQWHHKSLTCFLMSTRRVVVCIKLCVSFPRCETGMRCTASSMSVAIFCIDKSMQCMWWYEISMCYQPKAEAQVIMNITLRLLHWRLVWSVLLLNVPVLMDGCSFYSQLDHLAGYLLLVTGRYCCIVLWHAR